MEHVLSAKFWFRSFRYIFTNLRTSLAGGIFELSKFTLCFLAFMFSSPSESPETQGHRYLDPTPEDLQLGFSPTSKVKLLNTQVWAPLGVYWGRADLGVHWEVDSKLAVVHYSHHYAVF